MNLCVRTLQRTKIAGNNGLTLRVKQLLKRIQCPLAGSGIGSWCGRRAHARCDPGTGRPSI